MYEAYCRARIPRFEHLCKLPNCVRSFQRVVKNIFEFRAVLSPHALELRPQQSNHSLPNTRLDRGLMVTRIADGRNIPPSVSRLAAGFKCLNSKKD